MTTLSKRIDDVLVDARSVATQVKTAIDYLEELRADDDHDFGEMERLNTSLASYRVDEVSGICEDLAVELARIANKIEQNIRAREAGQMRSNANKKLVRRVSKFNGLR